LIAPLCALISGCSSSQLLEQIIEQTYPVDPAASITLKNIDGTIQLYGSPKPEVHLQAIKKAYTTARLDGIAVNVRAQSNGVAIDTQIPSGKQWSFGDRSGTVDYVVVVPQTAKIVHAELRNGEIVVAGLFNAEVHATLENGRVFVRNCFGEVHANSGTGALAVTYDWWEQHKFSADAQIADGNLFAIIPSDATFRVHAEAPTGKIGNDFTEKKQRTGATVTKLDDVVGSSPEVVINLRADDGNIKIVEANP
jgi:DUF4097 and DUF4098 domain-containing protein YvlB